MSIELTNTIVKLSQRVNEQEDDIAELKEILDNHSLRTIELHNENKKLNIENRGLKGLLYNSEQARDEIAELKKAITRYSLWTRELKAENKKLQECLLKVRQKNREAYYSKYEKTYHDGERMRRSIIDIDKCLKELEGEG